MAIVPSTKYAGQIDTSDPSGYPQGKAQNVATAGDGTGTPLEKAWVNDLWGFLQALLDRVGTTPSGNPDKVGTSDYLDALETMLGGSRDLVRQGYEVIGAPDSGQSFNPPSATPDGVTWDTFGTYLFTIEGTVVYQYPATTPWNLSTVSTTPTYSYDTTTQTTNPNAMKFSADGSRFYVMELNARTIYQYLCSSGAFDLTTGASYQGSYTPPSGTTTLRDFVLSHDGTRLITCSSSGTLYDHDITTPWDLTGTMTPTTSLDVNTLTGFDTPWWIALNGDSTRLFVGMESGDVVNELFLLNPGRASTAYPNTAVTNQEWAIRKWWIGPGSSLYTDGNVGTFAPGGRHFLAVDNDGDVRQLRTVLVTGE